MNKKLLAVVGGLVAVAGGGAAWWFASTDIDDPVQVTAPTLSSATTASDAGAVTTQAPDSESSTSGETTVQTDVEPGGAVTFELVDGSLVTFELDEELNGSPKRVVATNPEVAAQLRIDPTDLSSAELGTVLIGAQTFTSDSGNRDRAIRGPILDSEVFPTIEFAPTAVEGLSGAAGAGNEFEFTVTGDLTIRDITTSVTFDVSATFTDESTITGSAETTVLRSDFDLQIPSVPIVANVSDEVLLKIDFVAATVG